MGASPGGTELAGVPSIDRNQFFRIPLHDPFGNDFSSQGSLHGGEESEIGDRNEGHRIVDPA